MTKDFSLRAYNTFNIAVSAKHFDTFSSISALENILNEMKRLPAIYQDLLILGGGSNLLFTKNYDGVVLKNEIKGIETVHEDEDHVYVKAGAGEPWHGFVRHCVHRNLAGVENLSLIPGNVGASPMQNIGAYGVELKDVFHSLEALHLQSGKTQTFSLNDCEFGYRESVFKKRYKNQFAITAVTFRLDKYPQFHISYGSIREELEKMNITELSVSAVSEAIINIRRSKLPDPGITGNAGSFFKNPVIPAATYEKLILENAGMPGFRLDNGDVKLAAAWLIEQCGWKGYRKGDAGCYPGQALVLVNYGNATGQEILQLSKTIQESVNERFGVTLEKEVNIL